MKHNEPSSYLSRLCDVLRNECVKLISEITAEKHSRLAFGVSCMVLTLMGSVLGIVFRSGHLLTAFGVSFIPAALCLITIFTGKHSQDRMAANFSFISAFPGNWA